MTELYLYEVKDDADWALYEPLLSDISGERRERIARMPSGSTKILSLCAEVLLRRLACERLAVTNEMLQLAWTEHGKPYLAGYEHFFFNWSHTRGMLALALAKSPVGVDVERIPPKGDVNKLANRFFTKKEASHVSSEVSKSAARFCEIWTRKEAYTKFTGTGLTVAPGSFDVLYDAAITSYLTTLWHKDCVLSLCCDSARYELTELTDACFHATETARSSP